MIGPITFGIANWLTDGLVGIFDQYAALGGLIYGGIYALLVVTGMHHTFLAVDLQLIGSKGNVFMADAGSFKYCARICSTGDDVPF